MHLVVDSTGVKVYGEGEWKTRIHGVDKRKYLPCSSVGTFHTKMRSCRIRVSSLPTPLLIKRLFQQTLNRQDNFC